MDVSLLFLLPIKPATQAKFASLALRARRQIAHSQKICAQAMLLMLENNV